MNAVLQNKLYNIDPIFFSEAIACKQGKMDQMTTCMAFGCQCGDGWFKPLEKFAYKVKIINQYASQFNFKFICSQLKEKFGELRVYYRIDGCLNELGVTKNKSTDYIEELFKDALHQAEKDCWNVCERCGQQGGIDGKNLITTSGWISRICKKCAQNSQLKQTQQYDDFNGTPHQLRITLFKQGYYFLNMFYESCFQYKNQLCHSIIEAYVCSKDKDHKNIYKMISRYTQNHSYVIYQIFKSYGYELQQLDYDLLKEITKCRFSNKYNRQQLAELMQTNGYRLSNMGRHCNNIYGYCVCDKCKGLQHKDLYAKILTEVRRQLIEENNKKPNLIFWKKGDYYVNDQSQKELKQIKICQLRKYLSQYGISDQDIKIII